MVSVEKFLKEKRWALFAIILGTLIGFISAIICIAWNLVIFGFNIMYIISPLIAGFIETYIANKKYGKSTGAISALLTFIIINGYGWFSPGWLFPKEPASLSLITIIAIILTLQAAFPTLINYILIVLGIGTFKRLIEIFIHMPSKIKTAPAEIGAEKENIQLSADEVFLDELTIPLLSVTPIDGEKIKEYIGLVGGEAVAKEKEVEGRVSKLAKIIEPTLLDDLYLGEARKMAISRMLEDAKSLGANAVIDVIVSYVSMGGIQGSALIVTATGTGVIFEGKSSNLEGDISRNEPLLAENEAKISANEIPNSNKETIRIDKKVNIPNIVEKRRIYGQIIGKEVIDSSATVIGKIKDVEIDIENNEIESIILGKSGIFENLGMSNEEIIVPYEEIKHIGDKVLINKINRDEMNTYDYYIYLAGKIKNIK